MLKIRLSQTGSNNRRLFRIVAIEEGKKRDGKAKEILGYYNPLVKPVVISVNKDRVSYWISKGAQVTPSAKKLIDQA